MYKKIVLFVMMLSVCVYAQQSSVRTIVKVMNEQGESISNADVSAVFYDQGTTGRSSPKTSMWKGTSDATGIVFVEGETCWGELPIIVSHDGFYKSIYKQPLMPRRKNNNCWEPWGQTIELVLRKKQDPVQMIHMQKYEWLKIPVLDEQVGFDLERSDWVKPYGNGVYSDFLFLVSKSKDRKGASLTLEFPNRLDGIQIYNFGEDNTSNYKWPYIAPKSGYITKLKKGMSYTDKGRPIKVMKEDDEINYIFRVRSVVDLEGRLISAHYGKIRGELKISPAGNIQFEYWFNPEGTRNLEEDPKKSQLIR